MTSTISSTTSSPVAAPLDALLADQPLHCPSVGVTVYPVAGVAFIEGEPTTLEALEELTSALVSAAASINSGATLERDWTTVLGTISIGVSAVAVMINGERHAPSVVAGYAADLDALLGVAAEA